MTNFTSWLYAHYIKPYLDQCPQREYEMAMCLTNDLDPDQQEDFARALEFCASRAFLLGVKTGAGLRDAVSE